VVGDLQAGAEGGQAWRMGAGGPGRRAGEVQLQPSSIRCSRAAVYM
jgi:hypothetical protein